MQLSVIALLSAALLASPAVSVPTPSSKVAPTLLAPRAKSSPAAIARREFDYVPFHLLARSFPELGESFSHLSARDFAEPAANFLDARGVAESMLSNAKYVRDLSMEDFNLEPRSDLVARKNIIVVGAQRAVQKAAQSTCLDGTTNATYISSLFYYGGAGTTVFLCKHVQLTITEPIFFSAANQTLATIGYPHGAARATIIVAGATQSCAVSGQVSGGDNIALRNLQIDGSRPTLGLLASANALIEMGGDNVGQWIDDVHAYEPRGWSCLHAIEGTNNNCNGMRITNNQIGPSGHAPSGTAQFRKRDNTGTYAPGEWADGISLACAGSTVTGNVVTDATDGGIVIFGAPGSTVSGNTIRAVNRQLLGGINMVDWSPFAGSFEGTVVSNNNIISQQSMIKVGVAIGGMVWGVDNRTESRTYAGTVQNNVFSSGSKGYFGYSIGIVGHNDITLSNNDASQANFGGVSSPSCFPEFPLPPFQGFVADPWTTPGMTTDTPFYTQSTLVLLICSGPGAITTPKR